MLGMYWETREGRGYWAWGERRGALFRQHGWTRHEARRKRNADMRQIGRWQQ